MKTNRGLCWAALAALVLSLNPLGVSAQDAGPAWANAIGAPQYFAVLVTDLDHSREWYRRAFGLSDAGGSRADDGSWEIVNLRNSNLSVELIRDDRAQEVERAKGFFKVGFQVPDVRAVARAVEGATGVRPRVVESTESGVRIIQIHDPDGNTIQLASPLDAAEGGGELMQSEGSNAGTSDSQAGFGSGRRSRGVTPDAGARSGKSPRRSTAAGTSGIHRC